jgi:hypothetical protein
MINKFPEYFFDRDRAFGQRLYDTRALKKYAEGRRMEAMAATSEERRTFCLEEAEMCERRLRRSLFTPVIRG